jgi:hypothetical protein
VVQTVQVLLGDRDPLGQTLRTAVGRLADDHAFDTLEGVALHDPHLVSQIGLEAAQHVVDDRLGALVALDAFAGEHLHIDDDTVHARRHAQRGVLNVGGLLTEDRTQQLLFRRELGLALGRDLADQHVTSFNLCADIDNA